MAVRNRPDAGGELTLSMRWRARHHAPPRPCTHRTGLTVSYERRNIREMQGYTWGEQPQDADTLKLNTNENPDPPGPAVAAALQAFDITRLRRYPPPLADDFRDAAAAVHGVTREHIVVTHGGDELLRLALTTFLDPGVPLGVLEPSYSLYPVLAQIQDCPLAKVQLDPDYQPPADTVARWNAAGSTLAMVVNPHAPSGTLLRAEVLEAMAGAFRGVLLIDEAYVDFVDPAHGYDAVTLAQRLPNVLLLRTLSKGYSLAGLRFAYGIGNPELLAPIVNKTRDSYNMDTLAQALATAAMRDQAYASGTWLRVRAERDRLDAALSNLGLVAPPSESNFLLVTVPGYWALGARAVYEQLKSAGILVRYFAHTGLADKLRITVGTPEENDRLLAALGALAGQPSRGTGA